MSARELKSIFTEIPNYDCGEQLFCSTVHMCRRDISLRTYAS
jgi:hypothetical protein